MKSSILWILLLTGGFIEFLLLNPGTRLWLAQAIAMWAVMLKG